MVFQFGKPFYFDLKFTNETTIKIKNPAINK